MSKWAFLWNIYIKQTPITIPEFSENNFEKNFFFKSTPKIQKIPLDLQNVQKHGDRRVGNIFDRFMTPHMMSV